MLNRAEPTYDKRRPRLVTGRRLKADAIASQYDGSAYISVSRPLFNGYVESAARIFNGRVYDQCCY